MNDAAQIHGHVEPRFAAVREAFAQSFTLHGEQGAALAIQLGDRLVVDLWGGLASRAEHKPWQRDTLVNVYSTTKGWAALCAHHLIDAGRVELDAPLARYWPEFAAAGKQGVTVRHVLGHRAGLPAVRKALPHTALYDQSIMAQALAEQAPFWEPGTQHGYHAQTFGFLLAELVLRVTGKTLGRYFRDEIAGPLGADAYIGLPASEDARVARVTRPLGEAPPPGELDLVSVFMNEPHSLTAMAFTNPAPAPGAVNSRAWRQAEIPASNGHVSAAGLAALYGALASGSPRLLSPAGVARCAQEQAFGPDAVLRVTTRFGLGFMLSQPSGGGWFSPNPAAFGHPGLGGSIGFADPQAQLAFGYVMNRAGMNILVGDRPRRLIEAAYRCL
jgi:CubicO group peptidase (beta-lactamase class C family)